MTRYKSKSRVTVKRVESIKRIVRAWGMLCAQSVSQTIAALMRCDVNKCIGFVVVYSQPRRWILNVYLNFVLELKENVLLK